MFKTIVAAALLFAGSAPAFATSLEVGSTFNGTFNPGVFNYPFIGTIRENTGIENTPAVGAELDALISGGSLSLDFGQGVAGDEFVIGAAGSVGSIRFTFPSQPKASTFFVDSLDFASFSGAFDVEIISSIFADTKVDDVSASGFTLSWTDGPLTQSDMVRGRLVPVSPVPLPAGMPLLFAGIGALALLRRRP